MCGRLLSSRRQRQPSLHPGKLYCHFCGHRLGAWLTPPQLPDDQPLDLPARRQSRCAAGDIDSTKSFRPWFMKRTAPLTQRLVDAFQRLQFADDLFERNYSELDGRFGTNHRGSPAARPRQLCPRHELIFESVRRLDNYLAAVKTLVDHTRTFRDRHASGPAVGASCDARLDEPRARRPDVRCRS